MNVGKALAGALVSVTAGVGYVVASGQLHGHALTAAAAGLAALDTLGTFYAVWRVPPAIPGTGSPNASTGDPKQGTLPTT